MMFPANPYTSMVNEEYWRDLLSTGEQMLALSGDTEAVDTLSCSVIEPNMIEVEEVFGSLFFAWEIVLRLEPRDYVLRQNNKSDIEKRILSQLNSLHDDSQNSLCAIRIEPIVKRYLRWEKALPKTKDEVIGLIKAEESDLSAIATGTSYKTSGLEERYRERHREIIEVAQKVGLDYPVADESLASWWQNINKLETYAERRAYIADLFSPVYDLLSDSDDSAVSVTNHVTGNKAVLIALKDAQAHIDVGQFTNAVDRVHTAFHGYLREVLDGYQIQYVRSDNLSALLTKLHEFYGQVIQPPEVAARIKTILRCSGGIVQSVNEIRNNNTVAHPTHQLIEKREAELVVRVVDALLCYIEDIESQIQASSKH